MTYCATLMINDKKDNTDALIFFSSVLLFLSLLAIWWFFGFGWAVIGLMVIVVVVGALFIFT